MTSSSSQNTLDESFDDTFDQIFDQHFDQTFENFTIQIIVVYFANLCFHVFILKYMFKILSFTMFYLIKIF